MVVVDGPDGDPKKNIVSYEQRLPSINNKNCESSSFQCSLFNGQKPERRNAAIISLSVSFPLVSEGEKKSLRQ